MSGADVLMIVALLAGPVGAAAGLAATRANPVRDAAAIAGLAASAAAVWGLIGLGADGKAASLTLAQPLPGAALAVRAGALELVFAALIASLAALGAVYGVGFSRAIGERAPARLQAWLALTATAGLTVVFAADLFTLFAALTGLSLSAFGLLGHGGGEAAQARARLFLTTALAVGAVFLAPALVWTYALTGALAFRAGGLGLADLAPLQASLLLGLYIFGVAPAAVAPWGRWLTASHTAPPPVALAVQAVIVTGAGAAALYKITLFAFGAGGLAAASWGVWAIVAVMLAGALMAALLALAQRDLRARLAYASAAQLGLIAGAALLHPTAAVLGGLVQVIGHALSMFALVAAAGSMQVVAGRIGVRDASGFGRLLPWSFAAFAIGALSLAGLAPMGGAWSVLWLAAGVGQAGAPWAAAAVVGVAVATFAALAPVALGALFSPAPTLEQLRPDGASILMTAPTVVAAAATLALVFWVDPLAAYLAAVLEHPT